MCYRKTTSFFNKKQCPFFRLSFQSFRSGGIQVFHKDGDCLFPEELCRGSNAQIRRFFFCLQNCALDIKHCRKLHPQGIPVAEFARFMASCERFESRAPDQQKV